jgi:predicted secreted protein
VTTYRERREARLKGSAEATREWMRLGLDAERAVDVFGVIEDKQVWLLFEPLEHLYGFFERHNGAAGIVLHNGHPLSLQRFTAAHEYGHFVLGHDFSQDTSRELFNATGVPVQEIEAQAFAAEFLMPLPLVNRALDRLSLARKPESLTPIDAYQLSLEMGSSYRATITQLNQLNKISDGLAVQLRGWEPIKLKVELGAGRGPGNSRADVWDVDERRAGRQLQLRLDDELHVRLPEVPTSGYRWEVDVEAGDARLDLLVDELELGLETQERVGDGRRRHLWWRAVAPGVGLIGLRLVRPWQGADAEPVDALKISLSVQLPRTGVELSTGISVSQRRAMLEEVA